METWRSNCLIEMLRHYFLLRLQGERVATWWRKSDAEWVPFHCGWQVYDFQAHAYVQYSFKPVAFEKSVPLHRIFSRWFFVGRIVQGDDPPSGQ